MPKQEDTPLMRQWREAKSRHADALVFFRVGDFYEMFCEDAEEGARLLGLTLTSRNNGAAARVPLAGIPVKARDEYLQRLVRLGRRVAICEQVEDPADAKEIVRREVVETITPGAVLSDALLHDRRNNWLVALVEGEDESALAAVDVTTGEFVGTRVPDFRLESEIARFEPAEILLPRARHGDNPFEIAIPTYRPDWLFDPELAADELRRHFSLHTLDGLGFQDGDEPLLGALGALLAYVREVQPACAATLRRPRVERPGEAMALDEMTRRNLELIAPLRPDAPAGAAATLIDVIDETVTAMGGRLLRRWLLRPLVAPDPLWRRQEAVAELVDDPALRRAIRAELRQVRDLERLAAKVGGGRVSPRELAALGASLGRIPPVLDALSAATVPLLAELRDGMDPLADVRDRILGALGDDPPATLGEGGVIRDGHDAELDDLRATRDGARDFIASLQARERERTGISSLKVGFNKVFGYYLEVTKANLERVPTEYRRKQTLANAERYVTTELDEWEAKVLGAEDRIADLEARLFGDLRRTVAEAVPRLLDVAVGIAALDALAALARLAERRGYVRPEIHTGFDLELRGGRHPVVETMMPREEFIPNDVVLDHDARVMILTGPNMAGKSTLLRQVGLIQLLGQIGSFVPAASARIPIADRIFTRVGASDNLVRGQSTFMVEMSETASILHNATDRSLVLLDEIGRGTATYDGVSIAWAVTEHLHERLGAKTVFATHYHELTQLADLLPALVNWNVAVKETGDDIVFLRRLEPGGADRSYGIQVGRLAGLPDDVVRRAREILAELEGTHTRHGQGLGRAGEHRPGSTAPPGQLSFFATPGHPVVDRLRELDVDRLTPLEALNLLAELRREADG
ncbi:MAG TPA: DNA mismatch repair protein MutS [Longimicrobiales bacterium]|nr:DNA mismatch repair protein MutS [Longimicrobiales bacterium]